MKKTLFLLFAFLCSMGMWADDTTHKMSSYSSNVITDDQNVKWDLVASGGSSFSIGASNALPSDLIEGSSSKRGVSVFSATSAIKVTSQSSFSNVTKVVVYASANGSTNGSVSVKVGSTTMTAPSSVSLASGDKNKSYEFTSETPLEGVIEVTLPYTSTKTVWFGGVVVGTGALQKSTSLSFGTTDKFEASINEAFVAPTLSADPAEILSEVVYSTSDNTIADVNVSTGAVTIMNKVGKVNITATFAGNTTYKGSTASYTINVKDPNNTEVKAFTLVFKESGGSSDSGTKYSTTVSSVFTDGADYVNSISNISNAYPARTGRGMKLGTGSATGSITINLKDGIKATKVVLNASGYAEGEVNAIKVGNDSNTPSTYASRGFDDLEYTLDPTVTTSSIKISTATKRGYVKSVTFYVPAKAVSVNSCGNASFSCGSALDFTNADVKAYMVTAETAENITLTEIKKVPANTGIFVLGNGGTYNIPVLDGDADDASANKLVATTEPKGVTATDNIWALSKNDGKLHPVTSGIIAAGKAYLVSDVIGATANARGFIFAGTTTGINAVTTVAAEGVAYNLAGQRVAANAKGIVIVNGKKFINK